MPGKPPVNKGQVGRRLSLRRRSKFWILSNTLFLFAALIEFFSRLERHDLYHAELNKPIGYSMCIVFFLCCLFGILACLNDAKAITSGSVNEPEFSMCGFSNAVQMDFVGFVFWTSSVVLWGVHLSLSAPIPPQSPSINAGPRKLESVGLFVLALIVAALNLLASIFFVASGLSFNKENESGTLKAGLQQCFDECKVPWTAVADWLFLFGSFFEIMLLFADRELKKVGTDRWMRSFRVALAAYWVLNASIYFVPQCASWYRPSGGSDDRLGDEHERKGLLSDGGVSV